MLTQGDLSISGTVPSEGFNDLQPSVIHGSTPPSASPLTQAGQVIGHLPCQNGFAHTCHEGSGDETLKPSRTLQGPHSLQKSFCVLCFLFLQEKENFILLSLPQVSKSKLKQFTGQQSHRTPISLIGNR